MKKLWNIGSWILGFTVLLIMLAFSNNHKGDIAIDKIEVHIDFQHNQHFVTDEQVRNIVKKEYPLIDSLLYREINIYMLEERLDNHPSIRKAEVYSALDGTLRIDVSQKQPVFRVHGSKVDYYIAELGDSMALSSNFSANVPIITGTISAETRHQLFDFFGFTQQDSFYKNFFTGININKRGEWILYPKPGRHHVLLGKPENVEKKLKKLRVFYENVVDQKNIENIKTLNLAFEDQVICTKY